MRGQGGIALDGKTLRASFDAFHDRAAVQVLSTFATDIRLVPAHPDIAEKPRDSKRRNRDERRTVTVFYPAGKLTDPDWQPHLATIVQVERGVVTRSAATGLRDHSTETSFYFANTTLTAASAAAAIRAHRGIEATCHYSRDVAMAKKQFRGAGRIARSPVAAADRPQVQSRHNFRHEPREVALRQPLINRR
jgi:predicted transposase YbfD/YdcC